MSFISSRVREGASIEEARQAMGDFKDLAAGIQSIVTSIGIIVGGSWALFTFWNLGTAHKGGRVGDRAMRLQWRMHLLRRAEDVLEEVVGRGKGLGDLNEPMILGAIAAVEMGLELTGVPHGKGGVTAAMDYLVGAG
jgi:hypothetical protein